MAGMATTPADLAITAVTAKGNEYRVAVYVDPFPGRKGAERIYDTCGKCAGTGVVNWGNVTFVAQGREDRHCFDCNGTGKTSRLVSSARATARRDAKAATLAAAADADAAADRVEWAARGYGDLLDAVDEALRGLRDGDPLRRQALAARERINLYAATEADAQAAQDVLDAVAAREAAKVPVVEGRYEIQGEVLTVKVQDGAYGSSLKMLVAVDGYKVWGTVPNDLYGVERGDKVAFTATVAKSDDDEAFGFYSRPTKARRLDG
ncbi:ssDNA binding protein [Arthrobacter phage Liebe]|uniref:SsDNA binding protein n=2 Tax=Arthrobacter virus Liebe TaxID=2734245 RepID=A0A3G2KHR1_9CAUD|nr:ssDNA binding protein [Arthrobacter phage Liebe]AYN58504.1 hypothetical protein PBI_MAUREEN_23 [Arthrobacter phage Maureen]AZF93756.1 hypothetical protein PBI_LIEBE_23 [Arthrobacter phage Liebe]